MYAFDTDQGFPQFCDETVSYDCVDITFANGCGCWGGSYPGATQYLFGGTLTFNVNAPINIWSIELDQYDYCGGTCTFFKVFDINNVMVYEAFADDITNAYVNINNIPIGYYQYGSCEAAIVKMELRMVAILVKVQMIT